MKNFTHIEVYTGFFCRFIALLSVLVNLNCYSITYSEIVPSFKKEWNEFMKDKEFDYAQAASEHYQEYEFSLIEEFSDQQCSRFRPYIETMDRHDDCRPYEDTQIVLSNGSEMSASFVRTSEQENQYQNFIASQAPLKQSIQLFWQMILEHNLDQVVMLTEFLDIDNKEELADLYWPTNVNETLILKNDISVTLLEEKNLLEELEEYIQIRRFKVKSKNEERVVTHYWYRNWLDNDVPRHLQTLLTLINAVESDKSSLASNSPILVHCSAGVGRTGVFIVLYHLLERIKFNDQKIDLFEYIAFLRWQRPYLVGILPQYKYCNQMNELFHSSSIKMN